MDLSNCAVIDLVLNESFQKWILEPKNNEVHDLWERWLNKHPDKADVVIEARMIVDTIHATISKNFVHDEDEVWERISASICDDERTPLLKIKEIQNRIEYNDSQI
jgi:hypothetical protein